MTSLFFSCLLFFLFFSGTCFLVLGSLLPLVLLLPVLVKILSIFLTRPFHMLKGCNKWPWSLLQAEKFPLSQPVFKGEMFQSCHHSCCPPLELLWQVRVFLVLRGRSRIPELDTVFQVKPPWQSKGIPLDGILSFWLIKCIWILPAGRIWAAFVIVS